MKPPTGILAAARGSWKRAHDMVAERGVDPAAVADDLNRYALACDSAARLRAAWKKAGHPAVSLGGATGTVETAHPMLKAMADAERHADKLGERLGLHLAESTKPKGAGGRPPGAASAPDRKASSGLTKLKAV